MGLGVKVPVHGSAGDGAGGARVRWHVPCWLVGRVGGSKNYKMRLFQGTIVLKVAHLPCDEQSPLSIQ